MPHVYAHDVVGGAADNASCCLWRCQYEWPDARGELCMAKRRDAFFFDNVQSKWSHGSMAFACWSSYCSFVFNRIATFTTIVRPHLLRTPLYMHASMQETVMRMGSVLKLAFLSVTDIHTYIHTDAKRDVKLPRAKALGNDTIYTSMGPYYIHLLSIVQNLG